MYSRICVNTCLYKGKLGPEQAPPPPLSSAVWNLWDSRRDGERMEGKRGEERREGGGGGEGGGEGGGGRRDGWLLSWE